MGKWKEACLSVLSLRRISATLFMTLRLVPKGIMQASIAFSRLCLRIRQCNLALDDTLGEPMACKQLHLGLCYAAWCFGQQTVVSERRRLVWENASFWLEGHANPNKQYPHIVSVSSTVGNTQAAIVLSAAVERGLKGCAGFEWGCTSGSNRDH